MNNQPKISIIIPVYNVELYLRKCVDSILTQNYDNYEIILVDDGSTDKSGAICDEYASASFASLHHSIIPIRVIHQKNVGLSAARNVGVNVAQGEYVSFLDSDDFWCPNVLATLMKQIEQEQLDVLRFDYQNAKINTRGEYTTYQVVKPQDKAASRHEVVDGKTYLDKYMDYECYACQFVINRKMTGKFMPGILFEDAEWTPRMMLRAKRVNGTSTMVYNYLQRADSIVHARKGVAQIKKNVEGRMAGVATITNLICQYPQIQWLCDIRSDLANNILHAIADLPYQMRRTYINQLNSYNVFPLLDLKISKKYSRNIYFINLFGPEIFCCRLYGKKIWKNSCFMRTIRGLSRIVFNKNKAVKTSI